MNHIIICISIYYNCVSCTVVIPGVVTITAENRLQVISDISGHYFDPSVVYTEFLYLTDKVKVLLQSCDPDVLMEACRNLMASDVHKISLFSDEYVEKLSRYASVESVVWELTSYATWSDHSVLRLLAGSCEEALKLLDEFDSRLDPILPVASYDVNSCLIPTMLPSENSVYTLLAVKTDETHIQPSLQFVFTTKSLLMEKCDITQHCFQLLAVKHNPTVIYWMIPKCVVPLIRPKEIMTTEGLLCKGIVEISVYKHLSSSFEDKDSMPELQPLFFFSSEHAKKVCIPCGILTVSL